MANTNPTPKARFQSINQNIVAHRALIERPDFERACDVSLLEYQRKLSELDSSLNNAAACHFRILGAQEFLATLRGLAETPAAPKVVATPTLDHRA